MRHLEILKKAAIAFCALALLGGVMFALVSAAMYVTNHNTIATVAICLAVQCTVMAYLEEYR